MFAFIAHIFAVVAEVGSGDSTSPLSANSVYSEILRLVQLAAFAGIAYMVKEFKSNHRDSNDAHDTLLTQIEGVKQVADEAKALAESNYNANRQLINSIQSEIATELKAIHAEVAKP